MNVLTGRNGGGMDAAVLIVGAGPVGLTLGCELVRRGVPVRMVDAATTPSQAPRSRAVLVWPRTLELLHGTGVAEPLVDMGHRLTAVGYRSSGRLLGRARIGDLPDTPYPFAVTLPQYRTEQALLERFEALGGTVERGTVLERLRRDGPATRAVLRRPDGSRDEVTSGCVVGADGAHSTVRRELGIPFTGDTVDVTFGIADAPIDGPVDRSTLHYCYTRTGALGVVPLPDGLFRIAVSIPHRTSDEPPEAEVFRQALLLHAPGFGTAGTPRWTAAFRVRCRVAESFRDGWCFLAGDAAHIISPAGGQGMNYGIQDAVNLGWKLAGVIRGELAEQVLSTYHTERIAAVRRVAATTAAQTRWGLLRGPGRVAVRDAVVRAADVTGLLHRTVAPLMAQTNVAYRTGSTAGFPAGRRGRLRTGDRLPVLPASPSGPPIADVRPAPNGLTVLHWRGAEGRPVSRLSRTGEAQIKSAATLVNVGGEAPWALRAALGRRPALVTVRPDGHVAHVAPASDSGVVATCAILNTLTTPATDAALPHADRLPVADPVRRNPV